MLPSRWADRNFDGLARFLYLAVAFSFIWPDQTYPVPPSTTIQQHALLRVPVIKQPYMQCLVACVSMVLRYWGSEISPDAIAQRIPVYKDGTAGRDLAGFVEKIGFRGILLQPSFEDLIEHLEKGRTLIVTLPEGGSLRHAMVLVGFDISAGTMWLNDPASGECKPLASKSFRKRWEKGQRWKFLIVPK